MKRIGSFSKSLCLILLTSIFFTSCDIPDISEFTVQSTEMTRGIRQGIKDTGDVIQTAAANQELFEAQTRAEFKKQSKNYNTVMQPTLESLDALDSYVDALNALAQSNKKSGENAKALVGAVDNLVSSASKLVIAPPAVAAEIPDMALKIGTGIIAIANQYKTAKSFKERVNAARDIVEGSYDTKTEIVEGKKVEKEIKRCTFDKKAEIEKIGNDLEKKYSAAVDEIKNSAEYKNQEEKDKEKFFKDKLKEKIDGDLKTAEADAKQKITAAGCGIIDLLTFTMKDLKQINQDVSGLTERNFLDDNKITFNLYKGIDENDSRVQKEITLILNYESLLSEIKQRDFKLLRPIKANEKEEIEKQILNLKMTAKFKLDSIYILDGQARTDLLEKIAECDAPATQNSPAKTECRGMKNFIECGDDCMKPETRLRKMIEGIPTKEFQTGNGFIETVLNARAVQLFGQNEKYLTERDRIEPDYKRINSELTTMRAKQNKLDKLLTSSISALNTWTKTHANLRATLNTKKPISVAALAAKVKEIWAVIDSEEAE